MTEHTTPKFKLTPDESKVLQDAIAHALQGNKNWADSYAKHFLVMVELKVIEIVQQTLSNMEREKATLREEFAQRLYDMGQEKAMLREECMQEKATLRQQFMQEKVTLQQQFMQEKATLQHQFMQEKATLQHQFMQEKATLQQQFTQTLCNMEREKATLQEREQSTQRLYDLEKSLRAKLDEKLFRVETAFEEKEQFWIRLFKEERHLSKLAVDEHIPKGSTTRAQFFEEHQVSSFSINVNDYCETPEIANFVRDMQKEDITKEEQMYEPAFRALLPLFENAGVTLVDTHAIHYLDNLAPDKSTVNDRCKRAEATTVCNTIEWKHPKKSLTSECFGQLLDYVYALRRHQPNRLGYVTLLSNIKESYILEVVFHPGSPAIVRKSECIPLYAALGYFIARHSDERYLSAIPKFSKDLGSFERLFTHGICNVAEFILDRTALASCCRTYLRTDDLPMPIQVIVKRQDVCATPRSPLDIGNELKFLMKISEGNHQNLPRLLFYDSCANDFKDTRELGIYPVGEPINPINFQTILPLDFITISNDILDALQYLHRLDIIHRDVRWDNVVCVETRGGPRGMLIDFRSAVENGIEQPRYEGGYICVPQELIGELNKPYTLKPQHDLCAWLLLVHTALFPYAWKRIRSGNVKVKSSETAK